MTLSRLLIGTRKHSYTLWTEELKGTAALINFCNKLKHKVNHLETFGSFQYSDDDEWLELQKRSEKINNDLDFAISAISLAVFSIFGFLIILLPYCCKITNSATTTFADLILHLIFLGSP